MREVENIEQWKDIIGFKDFYQVSNFGRIKSKLRAVYDKSGKYLRSNKPKIMKPYLSRYFRISLNKNRKFYGFSVHRLVATHFIDNPDNKPCVNHKDGDKSNNHFSNLEWCTYSENTKHAIDNGLSKPPDGDPNCKNLVKFKKGNVPWNKGKRQKPPTHGTLYEYNLGCRCDKCKKANTDYCRVKVKGSVAEKLKI